MRLKTFGAAIPCLMLFAAGELNSQEPEQRVRWRFEIPSNYSGKFIGVGADGRVYTTSFSPANLYALTPDGSLVWTLNLGSVSGQWPISFAKDGTIYIGAAGVRAVNPDGTLRWAFDPGSWIIAGPSVGPDGNIYAADDALAGGLGFFSLDANGSLRWFNPGDPLVFGLEERLDEIVFGDGRLFGGIHFLRSGPWLSSYAFDLNGTQLWFKGVTPRYFELNSAPRMLPDGRVAYRAGQGSLAAVDQNGFAEWISPHPDGAQMLVQPAVGPDGSIYAGDEYGVQLWSANPDGTTRWVHGSVAGDGLRSVGLAFRPTTGYSSRAAGRTLAALTTDGSADIIPPTANCSGRSTYPSSRARRSSLARSVPPFRRTAIPHTSRLRLSETASGTVTCTQ